MLDSDERWRRLCAGSAPALLVVWQQCRPCAGIGPCLVLRLCGLQWRRLCAAIGSRLGALVLPAVAPDLRGDLVATFTGQKKPRFHDRRCKSKAVFVESAQKLATSDREVRRHDASASASVCMVPSLASTAQSAATGRAAPALSP